jgi:hypothetical protein
MRLTVDRYLVVNEARRDEVILYRERSEADG